MLFKEKECAIIWVEGCPSVCIDFWIDLVIFLQLCTRSLAQYFSWLHDLFNHSNGKWFLWKQKHNLAEMIKPCISKKEKKWNIQESIKTFIAVNARVQVQGSASRTSLQIDMHSFVSTKSDLPAKKGKKSHFYTHTNPPPHTHTKGLALWKTIPFEWPISLNTLTCPFWCFIGKEF